MQRSIDVRPPAAPGRDAPPPRQQLPEAAGDRNPMPRRTQRKHHGLTALVVTSLALILAATVGGLYVFGPGGAGRGGVRVTVAGPEAAVTSGDEVTYLVTVEAGDADLDVADLTLEYPVGFTVTAVQPPADNAAGQSLFKLAPLAAGGHAAVTVTGRLLGSVGTAAELRARLDYEPVNFSSSFHVEGSAVTSIAASRVHLTFDAPPTATSGGQLSLGLRLENVGDLTLNSLELVLELPEGVTFTSSTPSPGERGAELAYDLGTLDPGQSWSAAAAADIVGDGGSRRGLAAAVYQRLGDQRVILDRALREVEVVQPAAAVELYVGQSTGTSAEVGAGDVVPVEVRVRNTGQSPLDGVAIRLRLAGAVDVGSAQAGGASRDGDAVVWQVGSVAPGGTATAAASVPVRGDATSGDTATLVATVTSATYGEDWQAGSGLVTLTVR